MAKYKRKVDMTKLREVTQKVLAYRVDPDEPAPVKPARCCKRRAAACEKKRQK